MNIGIVGPFNPSDFKEFLDTPQNQIPNIHGAATAVNTLVKEFLELGHRVFVYTTTPYYSKPLVFKGPQLKITVVSVKGTIPKTTIFSRAYLPARIKPYIEDDLSSLDVIHAHWTYEYALAAKYFEKDIPVFCTIRDWCPYQYSIAKGWRNKLYWSVSYYVFNKVMKGNDLHFIANSNYTYDCLTSKYPEKEPDILFNPINKEFIRLERDSYPKDVQFVSISQSILNNRKNYSNLLKAFALFREENPSAKLHLVGNYRTASPLYKEWIKNNYLEGVVLHGPVKHDDLMKLLDDCSMLIHPSLEETFGNTLLEGMSRRIPVVGGKDAGAVPQVLGKGKYGILCDVTDYHQIYEAMKCIYNKEYINQLVDQATEYLCSNYKSDIIALKHISLYSKYLNKNSTQQ